MLNEAKASRMAPEDAQSSNAEEIPNENEEGSHIREPVEELQEKQEKYEVWSSPFEFQETLGYLRDGENRNEQKSLDMTLIEMGEDEAKLIGEAVASHPSLEVLAIKLDSIYNAQEKLTSPTSMWPMDSFLTAAFLGEKRNTSVLTLIIASSQTDGDTMRLGLLPQVLRENTRIRQLFIQWHGDDGTSSEEIYDLFEVLQGNSTIESLALPKIERWDFSEPPYQGFIDERTFKQILKLVERNTSIRKLQIHIGECRPTTDVNLDAFYRALISNSAIRILHLTGPYYKQVAESEFTSWIRTLTLRELLLDGEYLEDDDESAVLKVLGEALPDNRSLRRLDLDSFYLMDDDDFFNKLQELDGHPTLQEINLDSTLARERVLRATLERSRELRGSAAN